MLKERKKERKKERENAQQLQLNDTPASFKFIFRLFKHTSLQFLQQINVKNVMTIQYTVPGFELMTFGMLLY